MFMRPLLVRASYSPWLRGLYGRVRTAAVLGGIMQKAVGHVLPHGSRAWVRLRAGLGKGLWLNIDPRYEDTYCTGNYEPLVQKVLSDGLKQGSTFYEIGAHIGFFSLIAARLVGKDGAVFAFEAEPENARRIQEHAKRNGLTQVQVFPIALWSRCGSLRFERASQFSSRNTGAVVETAAPMTSAETMEVKAITLDTFVENHRPPTMVKIDVEGGESEVLKGAARVFAEVKPLLVCEVHHEQAAQSIQAELRRIGYSLEWLTGEPRLPRHLLARPPR